MVDEELHTAATPAGCNSTRESLGSSHSHAEDQATVMPGLVNEHLARVVGGGKAAAAGGAAAGRISIDAEDGVHLLVLLGARRVGKWRLPAGLNRPQVPATVPRQDGAHGWQWMGAGNNGSPARRGGSEEKMWRGTKFPHMDASPPPTAMRHCRLLQTGSTAVQLQLFR